MGPAWLQPTLAEGEANLRGNVSFVSGLTQPFLPRAVPCGVPEDQRR